MVDMVLDAGMQARLEGGAVLVRTEQVPGAAQARIVVDAMIEAAPEAVWPLIDQSARYSEYMPRVKRSEELSRSGSDIRTRMTLDMPFPLKNLTSTTRAKHTVEPGVRFMREWKLEEGDYHVNEGRWVLTPFAGQATRTWAHYEVVVLPKIPIPKAIQGLVQEKAMPKMIEALRERVKVSR